MKPPFITRVTIRNYKSIAACKVDLGPLTFLVGANGAGKSNFLDALRFVSDALRTSLDHALRERGGVNEVRRRSGGHPTHFALRFDFVLPTGDDGHYSFRIAAKAGGGYEVQIEECVIRDPLGVRPERSYVVEAGAAIGTVAPLPAAISDRLFLVAASGIPVFRPVFDALARIFVYNLDPHAIAAMQRPDPGIALRRDGSNAASVLQHISPAVQAQLRDDIARIVPGITDVRSKTLGSQETVEFMQAVKGRPHPWSFLASAVSDGTIRAFATLLAVAQSAPDRTELAPLLIGVEEPETALHSGAVRVLLSALRSGSRHCQIIVTSHSTDLLDNEDIDESELLAVENIDGVSRIGRIDSVTRDMMRQRLFTVGELMRQNQIGVDDESRSDADNVRQFRLFEFDRP